MYGYYKDVAKRGEAANPFACGDHVYSVRCN